MTEEDAKTRWCPFSRVSCSGGPIEGNHAANRRATGGSISPEYLCIASACMAWRWALVERTSDDSGQPVETWPDLMPFHPKGTLLTRHGICGLAGKP